MLSFIYGILEVSQPLAILKFDQPLWSLKPIKICGIMACFIFILTELDLFIDEIFLREEFS